MCLDYSAIESFLWTKPTSMISVDDILLQVVFPFNSMLLKCIHFAHSIYLIVHLSVISLLVFVIVFNVFFFFTDFFFKERRREREHEREILAREQNID